MSGHRDGSDDMHVVKVLYVSLFVILVVLSVVVFCAATHPGFYHMLDENSFFSYFTFVGDRCNMFDVRSWRVVSFHGLFVP